MIEPGGSQHWAGLNRHPSPAPSLSSELRYSPTTEEGVVAILAPSW